jgi:hypothetical protein
MRGGRRGTLGSVVFRIGRRWPLRPPDIIDAARIASRSRADMSDHEFQNLNREVAKIWNRNADYVERAHGREQ